jgi:hypothetical protein
MLTVYAPGRKCKQTSTWRLHTRNEDIENVDKNYKNAPMKVSMILSTRLSSEIHNFLGRKYVRVYVHDTYVRMSHNLSQGLALSEHKRYAALGERISLFRERTNRLGSNHAARANKSSY